jgi:hypothetical protein
MARDLHTNEAWHQNMTAEALNGLIAEMEAVALMPAFGFQFDVNADWMGSSQYIIYNELVDYAATNFTYDIVGGKINKATDWQQAGLWKRLQGLVVYVNSL